MFGNLYLNLYFWTNTVLKFLFSCHTVLELIRAAVGSAQMLMSQKVQQFFRMCQQSMVSSRSSSFTLSHILLLPGSWLFISLQSNCWTTKNARTVHGTNAMSHHPQDSSAYPQSTTQELANLWDLLQLAIEDVRVKFQDLQQMKEAGWRVPPEKKVRRKTILEPVYAKINSRAKPLEHTGPASIAESWESQLSTQSEHFKWIYSVELTNISCSIYCEIWNFIIG